MKNILPVTVVALSLTSCVLLSSERTSRTANNLIWCSSQLFEVSALIPAGVMDNCMRAQEFLKADDKERASAKYASMGLYSGGKDVKINNWGTISTKGSDLFSRSAEWTVKLERSVSYILKCTGDNQWTISMNKSETYDEFSDSTSFSAVFTYAGKDIDGFCSWKCKTEGTMRESDRYKTVFCSGDELTFNWTTNNSGNGEISSTLVYSGTFSSDFYVDDNKSDWCSLTYVNGERKSAKTSLN